MTSLDDRCYTAAKQFLKDQNDSVELLKWVSGSIATEVEDNPFSTEEEWLERYGELLGEAGLRVEDKTGFASYIFDEIKDQLEELQTSAGIHKLDEAVELELATGCFLDPFLGIGQQSNINYNTQDTIVELLKGRNERLKERERAVKAMREWERGRVPWPSPRCVHPSADADVSPPPDIIYNSSFCVGVGGRDLLRDAELKLIRGRRFGLIGRNGIGKSTFLGALVRKDISGIPKSLNISAIEQEVVWEEGGTPLDAVLRIDYEREQLLQEKEKIEEASVLDEASSERLAAIYDRLVVIQAEQAPTRARQILLGLGLSTSQIDGPVLALSGGWRVRVALARALFSDPDVLLLDEPSNHLDLHAVSWLMKTLSEMDDKTLVIVSHARELLNEVCTDIIDFRDMKLIYYKGDFDTFEKVSEEQRVVREKEYEVQQNYIAKQQQYINRFRAKASLASSVQSRIKQLAKLPRLAAVAKDPSVSFDFPEPDKIDGALLSLLDAEAIYPSDPKCRKVLSKVNLSVDSDSRVAVCGVNGSGKTTLLKMLNGALEPSSGRYDRASGLRVGYFEQHHVDSLDLTMSAVATLVHRFSTDTYTVPELEARNFLGQFGISGGLALEPLFILSGGQKSRVALAMVAYKKPHLLILDEPTNHLDLEAVQALIAALNDFKGGVMIVSHDAFFLTHTVDLVIHVEPSDGSVSDFKGSFDLYKKLLLHGGPRANPIELIKDKRLLTKYETAY